MKSNRVISDSIISIALTFLLGGGSLWAQGYPPLSPQALEHFRAADALQRQGDLAGAIREYRQAIALAPNRADLRYNLGIALYLQGDQGGAIAELHQATALNPTYADAHVYLGTILHNRGDLEGAIAEYREALRVDPTHAGAHTNLGVALKTKGDLDGAIQEYQQALALNPQSAAARHNLDIALREKVERQKASEASSAEEPEGARPLTTDIKTAAVSPVAVPKTAEPLPPPPESSPFLVSVTTENQEALFHYQLAQTLEARGDLVRAKREYQEAQKHDPRFAAAYCSLGLVLEKAGDKRGAAVQLTRCLKLASRTPQASSIRERLVRLGYPQGIPPIK